MAVFDSKTIRTQLLSVSLAVMLALAGCSTAGISNETAINPPANTNGEMRSSHTESPASKAYGMNFSEYAAQSLTGANQANLTDSQRAKVRDTVATFYNLSRNKSKRRQASLRAADAICKKDSEYKTQAKATALKTGGKASADVARRMDFAAQVVNTELNGDIERAKFKSLRDGVGTATKYVPLLGSYNSLVGKSCLAARQRTNESIEKFHIAVLMFGVDAALVAGSVYYKPAFAGTRFVTNQASKVGLYRLRYLCGNRCWALTMSEVHWAMRGTMLTVTSNLARTAIDMGADLTEEDVRAVLKKQGHDPAPYLQESNVDFEKLSACSSDVSSGVRNATMDAANQSDELLESDEEGSSSSGGGFGVGDVVNESKSALDDTRDAVSNESIQSIANRSQSAAEALNQYCSGVLGGTD